MIEAARRAWFTTWFTRQCSARIRKTFETLEVAGLERLVEAARRGPVVAVANHTSWWDPMMVLELSVGQAGLESFAMMDAKNLRRLRFFSLVGAFGVDLSSRRDGARAIHYGAGLLERPRQVLWVFPQGSERPAHEPLRFFSGAARVAELSGATVVPIGLRYVLGSTPRPRALAAVGEPLDTHETGARAAREQQDAVAALLAKIDQHQAHPDSDFESIHQAEPPWLDGVLTGALDRFANLVLGFAQEQPALAEAEGSLAPADAGGAEGARERGK